MPTSTQLIIEEFLRSSDSQLRRNAIAALAALSSPDNVARLVESAVNDSDEIVRARAEAALKGLEPTVQARATELLIKALSDKARRTSAYGVLGRLRPAEPLVPVPRLPLWRRLRLARTLKVAGAGLSRWEWRRRLVLRGLLGGFAGLTVAFLYFWLVFGLPTLKDLGSVSLLSLLFAPVLLLVVTWRSQPVPLHYSRAAGSLVEVARIAIACLVFSAVVGFLLFFQESSSGFVLKAGLAAAVALAAARWAGILVYGITPHPQANLFLQTVVGALIGLAVAGGAIALLGHNSADKDIYGVWVFLIPSIVGASYAYALVDAQGASLPPNVRGGSPLPVVLATMVLGAFLWAGFDLASARLKRPAFSPQRLPLSQVLTSVPTLVDFSSSSPEKALSVRMAGGAYALDYLNATLRNQDGRPVRELGNGPVVSVTDSLTRAREKRWTFEKTQDSLYRLEVDLTYPSAAGINAILPALLATFSSGKDRLRPGARSLDSEFELSITDKGLVEREQANDAYQGRDIGQQLVPSKPIETRKDSVTEAKRLASVGKAEMRQGHIGDALLAYGRATALGGAGAVAADDWNTVCWQGSIQDELIDVEQACNKALEPDSTNPYIRDSRGVYRARTGDVNGAIEDFRVFTGAPTSAYLTKEEKDQRIRWISMLKEGKNPFIPDELRQLRGGSPSTPAGSQP